MILTAIFFLLLTRRWVMQDLSLEGSGLRQLPEALRAMGGLTALNVSQNQLSQLPGWLGRCTRLLSLQVSPVGFGVFRTGMQVRVVFYSTS